MAPACGSRHVSSAAEPGNPVTGDRQVVLEGSRGSARNSAPVLRLRPPPAPCDPRACSDRSSSSRAASSSPRRGPAAPTIQPMRTPGIPYAFDSPLVTMTRSLMPQKLARSRPVDLGAEIHLVGEEPRARSLAPFDDARHRRLRTGQRRSGCSGSRDRADSFAA